MTSVGTSATTSTTAAELVGQSGMALFGKKNPKWYRCVVKADNQDGTIKVQWDEGKKFTKRLPVQNFRLEEDDNDEGEICPPPMSDIFSTCAADDGDY